MKKILIVLFVLFLAGCTTQQAHVVPANTQETAIIEEVNEEEEEDILDLDEVTDEELADTFLEDEGFDLLRGSCPITDTQLCENFPDKVCGSDDRTYANPCDACENSGVELWFEGEC